MHLTREQMSTYEDQGFLLLPEYFTQAEVDTIRAVLPALYAEDTPRRVLEKETNVVRSVYGSHITNDILQRLSQHPRLVEPAMQILGSGVYVHQFKINAKAAFAGDVWEWHQDYVFWRTEDGMPTARVINAVLFLDEVNEFNGPLLLIPGSQQEGVIDVAVQQDDVLTGYADSPAWISNLTADLKYSLDRDTVARLVSRHGMVAPKGPGGSVLFFHGNLAHGSSPNMSPFDRALALVTYNSVENTLLPVNNPRPDFLASHDYRPVVPLTDDTLLP